MNWWQDQRKAWARDWGEVGSDIRRFVKLAKWLFGQATRVGVYAMLFGLLYMYWPTTNIFERPIGSLSLKEIGQTAFAIVASGFLVRCLFSPIDNDYVRRWWQGFGVLILFGIAAVLFLWR